MPRCPDARLLVKGSWRLSIAALVGVGLNGLFGWWWADPIAALAIAGLIVREGREAWQGKACC